MNKIRKLITNKGITLIELLVAIALVSIVIIGFLTFFSQSIIFSQKAEDKLTALNVAEKVVSELKMNANIVNNLHHYSATNIDPFEATPVTVNGKVYYPFVKIVTGESHNTTLNLWRVHVKIFVNQDQDYHDLNPVTEIFSFLDSDYTWED